MHWARWAWMGRADILWRTGAQGVGTRESQQYQRQEPVPSWVDTCATSTITWTSGQYTCSNGSTSCTKSSEMWRLVITRSITYTVTWAEEWGLIYSTVFYWGTPLGESNQTQHIPKIPNTPSFSFIWLLTTLRAFVICNSFEGLGNTLKS